MQTSDLAAHTVAVSNETNWVCCQVDSTYKGEPKLFNYAVKTVDYTEAQFDAFTQRIHKVLTFKGAIEKAIYITTYL